MKVSVILSTALCALVASVNAMPSVGVRAASDANNTDSTPPAMDSQVVRAGSDITNPERNNSSPTMAVTGVWASLAMETSFYVCPAFICIFSEPIGRFVVALGHTRRCCNHGEWQSLAAQTLRTRCAP